MHPLVQNLSQISSLRACKVSAQGASEIFPKFRDWGGVWCMKDRLQQAPLKPGYLAVQGWRRGQQTGPTPREERHTPGSGRSPWGEDHK